MPTRRCVRSGLVALVLCAALCSIARAREWYVSKTGSNADGQSWATAFNHPQSAIDAAFADGGGEVWVKADTYTPTGDGDRTKSFAMKVGVDIYGGFAGTESLRAQRNLVTNVTILSGDLNGDDDPTKALDDPLRNNSENSYHVVAGASDATLDGLTVTGGNANAGSGTRSLGGGMYCSGVVDLTVMNCALTGNRAVVRGGGIYIWGLNSRIASCTFTGNKAERGGAVYTSMQSSSGGSAITNCTFTGNSADRYGGALWSAMWPPTITNCIFWAATRLQKGRV